MVWTFFGLFSKTVRHYGGLWGYLKSLYLRDGAKYGRLVGTDKYGNRYYENNDYFFLRNRWVEYADHVGLNYSGCQIPAEWFGWMHHRTDLTPDQEPFRPKYSWILPHEENRSGTNLEYVPCTTTPPKILPWAPPRPPTDIEGGCGERKALSDKVGCGGRKTLEGKEEKRVCGEEKTPVFEKEAKEKSCENEQSPPECGHVKNNCGEQSGEEKTSKCEKPVHSVFH